MRPIGHPQPYVGVAARRVRQTTTFLGVVVRIQPGPDLRHFAPCVSSEAPGRRHRIALRSTEPPASALESSARELIPSFGNARYKCVLIVRCER